MTTIDPQRNRSLAIGRNLLVTALAAAIVTPAWATGWIEFTNESTSRLISSSGTLGLNDPEEKDYAWGDLDHDGDTDLVVVRKQPFTTSGKKRNVLFMNEGGVLVDRTEDFAVAADDGGQGFLDLTNDRDVVLVDVNNDTWLDIVTATTLSDGFPKTISHPRVYINLGESGGAWQGFRYEEERFPQLEGDAANGFPHAPRFCSVAAGDLTGDGWADLYFGDYDSGPPQTLDFNNRVLINDGTGSFHDESTVRMTFQMLESAFGAASAIEDMNGDGVLDVVKQTSLNPPQHVAITYNDPGHEGFFDRYDIVNQDAPYFIFVGDLNNDNLPDIVITDDNIDRYKLNQGNDANDEAIFTQHLFPSSTSGFGGNSFIADLDGDGWNDVVITDVDVDIPGCSTVSDILHNMGGQPGSTVTFQNDTGNIPSNDLRGLHDVAIFDLDDDGLLDMVFGKCNGTQVWMSNLVIMNYGFPDGIPDLIPPGAASSFPVTIETVHGDTVPGTVMQHVSIDGAPFQTTAMPESEPGVYLATIPETPCAALVDFYFSAQATNGTTFTNPPDAPDGVYSAIVAFSTEVILEQHFESPTVDWTVQNTDLDAGAWERVDPNGTTQAGDPAQPEDDAGDGDDRFCFVTQQSFGGSASNNDVDGGPTMLISPVIDLQDSDAMISYARWQFTDLGVPDVLLTQVTDNGIDWVNVDFVADTAGQWQTHAFRVGAFVSPTADVQVRFVSSDQPNDSVTESGIDDFLVTELQCVDTIAPEVLHGIDGVSFQNAAFGGYIDPKVESDNGTDVNLGIDQVVIAFSEPVTDIGGAELTPDAFTVTETGGAIPPAVVGLEMIDAQTVRLTLDRTLTIREWLTVTASVQDLAGIPIESLGDQGPEIDETDRVDIGFLPADIDQSGSVNPLDLLKFKQYVNGVLTPPIGANVDFLDINRSGGINPLDLLSFKRLINGVPPATQSWSGASMNNARP